MTWFFVAMSVTALVSIGVVYQWIGSTRDRRNLLPTGRMVDIGDGCRLHVDCRGEGEPTVVFEAGIAASSLSWSRVQPRVAEFARACAYDRTGLAWSEWSGSPISAVRLAEQLVRLLDVTTTRRPCVLVGHSFGAFVVQAFARRHPDRVAGMVLVDPIYSSEWTALSAEQRWRLRGGVFLSRVGALLARTGFVRACLSLLSQGSTAVPRRVSGLFGSEADQFLNRIVGEVQKLPREVWPAVQAHWSQPKSFVSMARHLACLTDSAHEIAGCERGPSTTPLIVISAGSQSAACLGEHARMAAQSSRGRHVIARGAGHWVHLDHPDLVIAAIRDVVAVVRSEHSALVETR